MRSLTILSAAALGLAIAGAAVAQQDPLAAAVKARQALMTLRGANVGVLGGMARGNMDYDAEAATAAAQNLVALASIDTRFYWPEGTSNADMEGTRALPAIWEEMDEFHEYEANLREATAGLPEAAGGGLESLQAAMGAARRSLRRLPRRLPTVRQLRRLLGGLAVAACLAAGAGLDLSAPEPLAADALDGRGRRCRAGRADVRTPRAAPSCHTAPDADWSETPVLAGGQRFVTDFGTFVAPNISPDADIWDRRLVRPRHRQRGAARASAREGRHLYPAFPYTSYVRAEAADVADLDRVPAHPAGPTRRRASRTSWPFPINIRRGIGLWKRLFLDRAVPSSRASTDPAEAGRYLAEALGHCGECHTPRGPPGRPGYRRAGLAAHCTRPSQTSGSRTSRRAD